MFSPFHSGKANCGFDTNCASNLFSRDIRSSGFSKARVSFWELITDAWFRIDNMSMLTECIPLQSIAMWPMSWNVMMKWFPTCVRALSYLER